MQRYFILGDLATESTICSTCIATSWLCNLLSVVIRHLWSRWIGVVFYPDRNNDWIAFLAYCILILIFQKEDEKYCYDI